MHLTSKMTDPKNRFHSHWKFPEEMNLTVKMNLTGDYETSLRLSTLISKCKPICRHVLYYPFISTSDILSLTISYYYVYIDLVCLTCWW